MNMPKHQLIAQQIALFEKLCYVPEPAGFEFTTEQKNAFSQHKNKIAILKDFLSTALSEAYEAGGVDRLKEVREKVGEDLVRPFEVKFNKDENGETIIDETALNNTIKLLQDQDDAYRRIVINQERQRIRSLLEQAIEKQS